MPRIFPIVHDRENTTRGRRAAGCATLRYRNTPRCGTAAKQRRHHFARL